MKTLLDLNIAPDEAAAYHQAIKERGDRFSCTCCGKFKVNFFASVQILHYFRPCVVYLRLSVNWTSHITTILILFGVELESIKIAGAVLIFLSNLILHFSHGFVQYPSVVRYCALNIVLNKEERHASIESFEVFRDVASAGYHGDNIRRSQFWQILVTLPFTIPMHIGAILGAAAFILLHSLSKDNNNRNTNNVAVISLAGILGILVGCLFFPIIYVVFDTIGIYYAQFGFVVMENLYDSLLFRKSFLEFLRSFLLSILDLQFAGIPEVNVGEDMELGAPPVAIDEQQVNDRNEPDGCGVEPIGDNEAPVCDNKPPVNHNSASN